MIFNLNLLLLLLLLAEFSVLVAAAGPHIGFSYGAFWTNQTAKREADFVRQFELAKSLQTSASLNSARLFTCVQWQTTDDPIDAFSAAIRTNTTLLLGIYNVGNDAIYKNEVVALKKGLGTHGQLLADLIIGISVGNEDIYRSFDQCHECQWGASATVVTDKVQVFKSMFQTVQSGQPAGMFAKYFTKISPIGHTDVARNAAEVSGVDFAGTTIYPCHAGNGAGNAKEDFKGTYNMVKTNAKGIDVWVTETGWPVEGETKSASLPGVDSLQLYWNSVGCNLIEKKINFWWFELESDTIDSTQGHAWDWAIFDSAGKQRINVTCPSYSNRESRARSDPPSPPSPEFSYPSTISGTLPEHASRAEVPSSELSPSTRLSPTSSINYLPPPSTVLS